jgi:hypothetical protein
MCVGGKARDLRSLPTPPAPLPTPGMMFVRGGRSCPLLTNHFFNISKLGDAATLLDG